LKYVSWKKATTHGNGKRHIKKGYRALDVRLPEQFSLIGKLRAQYPVVTLCHVFGVLQQLQILGENPEKPYGRRAVLRSQVLELHNISHGSAGARSIAIMATLRGFSKWDVICRQAHERT
jgi:putative transposase